VTVNGSRRPRVVQPTLTGPTLDELAAVLEDVTRRLEQTEQALAAAGSASAPTAAAAAEAEGEQPPLYDTVEKWVGIYLLPTFARPFGAVGMTRWHWCRQWWRHDEAVTVLTALWYSWEHARLEMTGMTGWLRDLYFFLPQLCGEEGPFRDCALGGDTGGRRHVSAPVVECDPAPDKWWDWW
jgi:hypothetical protein